MYTEVTLMTHTVHSLYSGSNVDLLQTNVIIGRRGDVEEVRRGDVAEVGS